MLQRRKYTELGRYSLNSFEVISRITCPLFRYEYEANYDRAGEHVISAYQTWTFRLSGLIFQVKSLNNLTLEYYVCIQNYPYFRKYN